MNIIDIIVKKKNKEMEKKRIEYKKLFNNEELDNLNIE